MRLTKHRQEILKLLGHSLSALSATAIHTSLPHINLVTVYRTLEYFNREGLIKKLYLNEQNAQYELQREPHHHAICNDCARVIHFTLDDKKFIKKITLPNFDIKDLEITIRGTCGHALATNTAKARSMKPSRAK